MRPAEHLSSGLGSDDASRRLQAAAEQRLLHGGLAAVSLRSIAAAAGANSALVSYYFDGLGGLLASVGHANVALMLADRRHRLTRAIEEPQPQDRLAGLLEAQLLPMLLPSACAGLGLASTVVRELLNGSDNAFKASAVLSINDSMEEVYTALAPLVPHLGPASLRLRLRMLTGAATYLVPHIDELGLFGHEGALPVAGEDATRTELLAFAHGALLEPEPGTAPGRSRSPLY